MLVVSGRSVLPAVLDENCITLLCNILKTQLTLNVSPSDFSTAHRAEKKSNTQQIYNRNIIIKLFKPNFYRNESLTPTRNSTMYVLCSERKKSNSKVVGRSSYGGRVIAWAKQSERMQQSRNRCVPVNTHSALVTFCRDLLGEPLSNYIEVWRHWHRSTQNQQIFS